MPSHFLRRRELLALCVASCAPSTEPAPSAPSSAVSSQPPSSAPPPRPSAPVWGGSRLLAGKFPGLASLPHVTLGQLPTPLEHARALGHALGVGELWIKRDDKSSSLFGGGKVRKLERILADATALGHRSVVTFGGVGSNHAVATAAFGKHLGMDVVVQLAPQPASELVAKQLAACVAFGATVETADGGVMAAYERALRAQSDVPSSASYVIAPGGTSDLGNLGMADAAFELAEQIRSGGLPPPDVVVLAMGTMGSTAGIAWGLSAAGLTAEVVAVRCSSAATSSAGAYKKLARSFATFLRQRDATCPADSAKVTVESGFLGPGYGRSTAEAEAAIRMARDLEGLDLEATYTGKALAAIAARAPSLSKRRVLFWASQPPASPSRDADETAVPASLRRYLHPTSAGS